MIGLAARHEAREPLGIRYLVEDAQSLASFGAASFDLVTCQLGLMDIPSLPAVLEAVARVLRPLGAFVFVIGHPSFLAPEAQTVRGPAGNLPGWCPTTWPSGSGDHGIRKAFAGPATFIARSART